MIVPSLDNETARPKKSDDVSPLILLPRCANFCVELLVTEVLVKEAASLPALS
jgi:hypothetical protein